MRKGGNEWDEFWLRCAGGLRGWDSFRVGNGVGRGIGIGVGIGVRIGIREGYGGG